MASAGDIGIASAQVRQGDPIADSYHVYELDDLFVHPLEGWACAGLSYGQNVYDDGPNFLFGSIFGDEPDVLRLPMTIGRNEQRYLRSVAGIDDDGNLYYNAICNGGFLTGQSSVWVDDTLIEIADEPSGYGHNTFWSGVGGRSVTRDGTLLFGGTITSEAGGDPEQAVIFFGSTATPVLLGGQSVPNVPLNLGMTSFTGPVGSSLSSNGTNFILGVRFDGLGSKDTAIVMNGEGLVLGGTLVRYENPIPASIGGLPGETYWIFKEVDINEDGDYFIFGLSQGTIDNQFLIKNGEVLHREGDVLDGIKLGSSFYAAADLNDDGDFIVAWSDQVARTSLFFNGEVILQDNNLVDWDGDGNLDPGYTFQGIREVAITDRLPGNVVNIYFIGYADTPEGLKGALFAMTYAIPEKIALADFVSSATFQPPPDGVVDGADLAFLLGQWGEAPYGSLADIVTSKTFQPPPDGFVDGADLAVLLGEWSP